MFSGKAYAFKTLSAPDIIILIILSAAGYFGNLLRFEVFYNVDFLFGSITSMYAIKRYGKIGIIPAFIASLYTYTLWNHPYAIIIFTAEAAFVAFFRKGDRDIIVLDLIYWLTLGALLQLSFYRLIMDVPLQQTQIVLLKQSINGVINTLFASVLFHSINYIKKVSKLKFIRISFRQTFFKIIILTAAIPAMLYVIVGVKSQTNELTEGLKSDLNAIYNTASISIDSLTYEALGKVDLLSEIAATHKPNELEDHIKTMISSSDTFMGLAYLDPALNAKILFNRIDRKTQQIYGVDFKKRTIYDGIKNTDKIYVSDLIPSKLQRVQHNLILLVKPLHDKDGNLTGFVQGGIDFKTMQEALKSVSRDSGVTLTLTDRKDNVIISSSPQYRSGDKYTYPSTGYAYDYDKRGIYLLTSCPANNVSVMTQWKNAAYIKKGALPMSGLTLVAQLPLSNHVQRVSDIGFNAMKITYIIIISCILGGLFISRQISFHIESLRRYSSELPRIVQTGAKPMAVNSVFQEVHELSDNFSNIASLLSAQFTELTRQKEELALILDSIPLIIFVKDLKNNLIQTNREAEKTMDFRESDVLGKNVKDIFPELADEVFQNDIKVINSKQPLIGTIQNYKLRNKTIIVRTDKIPMFDDKGNLAYLLVISRDITEELKSHAEKQKMLETLYQQSKMAEMGAMTAAIAHQWKQPLNTIALITQVMQSDAQDGSLTAEDTITNTEMIMKNIDFMAHTAEDFIEFFKTSKEKQLFRACETVHEVYGLIESQFRKHNITVDIHPHEHFVVYGLKNEFKQVCLNILNNAKDALIEHGGSDKRIDVFYEHDDNFRKIIVQDNGGGISPDLLPNKIFLLYQSTKGEKGTGLGLYICKSIIEEHMGGRITAENTEYGAKFSIFLPIDQTITKDN